MRGIARESFQGNNIQFVYSSSSYDDLFISKKHIKKTSEKIRCQQPYSILIISN